MRAIQLPDDNFSVLFLGYLNFKIKFTIHLTFVTYCGLAKFKIHQRGYSELSY